jgi:hypothetical protein
VQTVQSASSLLGKLSGERGRWEQQTRELRAELDTLPVWALLAAACITYLGTASEDMRAATIRQWSATLKVRRARCRRCSDAVDSFVLHRRRALHCCGS